MRVISGRWTQTASPQRNKVLIARYIAKLDDSSKCCPVCSVLTVSLCVPYLQFVPCWPFLLSSFAVTVPAVSSSPGGDVWVYVFDINQPSLPTPFYFCSCVCLCLCGPFNCISLHKFSWQFSIFSICSSVLISALLVFSNTYIFMKVSFSPDIIPSGWLGPKYHLINGQVLWLSVNTLFFSLFFSDWIMWMELFKCGFRIVDCKMLMTFVPISITVL